jgi:hypothetical protein
LPKEFPPGTQNVKLFAMAFFISVALAGAASSCLLILIAPFFPHDSGRMVVFWLTFMLFSFSLYITSDPAPPAMLSYFIKWLSS